MGAACHAQCMSSAGFVRSRLDLVLGPGDPSDVFQRFCANMGLASVLQALALFFSRAIYRSIGLQESAVGSGIGFAKLVHVLIAA